MEIKKQETKYKITHENVTVFMEIDYSRKMVEIYPNQGKNLFQFKNKPEFFGMWHLVLDCIRSSIYFAERELKMDEIANIEKCTFHYNFNGGNKCENCGYEFNKIPEVE